MTSSIREICSAGPVIPVIEIDDATFAIPLVEALAAGGIHVVEITLRTPQALDAIRSVAAGPENICVGAGTLLTSDDVKSAKEAGASFGVSPGSTPELIAACSGEGLPLLPGAATPSEVAGLSAQGFEIQKFFPAEAAGGTAMLKALQGPLQDISFCPTGGISPDNAPDYLALSNVICVGGSWIASRQLIRDQNWQQIAANARAATGLMWSSSQAQ